MRVTVKPGQKGHYYKGELHEAGRRAVRDPGRQDPRGVRRQAGRRRAARQRQEGIQLRREGQGQAAQASLIDQIQRGRGAGAAGQGGGCEGPGAPALQRGHGQLASSARTPRTEDEQRGGGWQQTLETRLGGPPTKEDLLAYAETRGVQVDRSMRKDEIVAAISSKQGAE